VRWPQEKCERKLMKGMHKSCAPKLVPILIGMRELAISCQVRGGDICVKEGVGPPVDALGEFVAPVVILLENANVVTAKVKTKIIAAGVKQSHLYDWLLVHNRLPCCQAHQQDRALHVPATSSPQQQDDQPMKPNPWL